MENLLCPPTDLFEELNSLGITGKVWAGIVAIIAVTVLIVFLASTEVMTSSEIIPALGMIVAIVVLTLIFGGKD